MNSLRIRFRASPAARHGRTSPRALASLPPPCPWEPAEDSAAERAGARRLEALLRVPPAAGGPQRRRGRLRDAEGCRGGADRGSKGESGGGRRRRRETEAVAFGPCGIPHGLRGSELVQRCRAALLYNPGLRLGDIYIDIDIDIDIDIELY